MAILDTILSTPVDIAKLRDKGTERERLLDGAFTNLLHYAKHNWSYTASGSTGGQALLNGEANAAPCGGIATALKLVFINGLGIPEADIEYVRVTGYLWTGREYSCFDPKVAGNLRKLDGGRDYGNGCIFNEHYYLKCGKYYDPCLSVVYMVKDQSIKQRDLKQYMIGTNRKLLVTLDKRLCFLYMPDEPVPGFKGAWTMFDTSKANIKKALGTPTFNTEMAALHGTTEFAKFVNTLT